MTETFKAIYRDGVLRPLQPLAGIPENQPMDVTVVLAEETHPLRECFGILADEDAREMSAIIEDEFEKVNLDEWC